MIKKLWIKCLQLTGRFATVTPLGALPSHSTNEETAMTEGADKKTRKMNHFSDEKVIRHTEAAADFKPRAGSKREQMFGLIRDGMTVAEYKAAAGKEAMSFLVFFANDAKVVAVGE